MKRFRFITFLFAGLLVGLAACQAASAPPKAPAPVATAAPTVAQVAPTAAAPQALTTFSPKTFKPLTSLTFGTEWKFLEEYSDVFTLKNVEHDTDFAFITPKNIKIASPTAPFAAIPFPDDFVNWIQSHGLFHVEGTHPVRVGGFQGTQVNATFTSACGEKKSWLYLSGTGWNCTTGENIRFINLEDVYGERVLIMTEGSKTVDDFILGGAVSQKVLDTVVFSKPTASILTSPVAPQLVENKIPTTASEPGGIVAGPDNALWFVETAVNKIGRITTAGVVTEYPVPTAGAIDTDQGFLAVGPDGALWFNEDLVNQIGRITTAGQLTEYKLPDELKPTQDDAPIRAIVTGPDGGLWVTSPGANAIVKLTMDGKLATKYTLPKAGSNPVGMVVGPDGALWFVEKGANQIGRITLDGKLSEYALPDSSSAALRVTVGPDKALWFTMNSANKIGRISTDGKITTFDAAGMGPVGITAGADGALWFTGYGSTEIGRMTIDGKLTKIQVPTTASVPYHITAGPDGNLWFTEQQGNRIGQIQLPVPAAAQNVAP